MITDFSKCSFSRTKSILLLWKNIQPHHCSFLSTQNKNKQNPIIFSVMVTHETPCQGSNERVILQAQDGTSCLKFLQNKLPKKLTWRRQAASETVVINSLVPFSAGSCLITQDHFYIVRKVTSAALSILSPRFLFLILHIMHIYICESIHAFPLLYK